MGILLELHRHCEEMLERGYKTVSAEYVIDMIKRYESECEAFSGVPSSKTIETTSNGLKYVTSLYRSQ